MVAVCVGVDTVDLELVVELGFFRLLGVGRLWFTFGGRILGMKASGSESESEKAEPDWEL